MQPAVSLGQTETRAARPRLIHLHITDNFGRYDPLRLENFTLYRTQRPRDIIPLGRGDLHLPVGWGARPAGLTDTLEIRQPPDVLEASTGASLWAAAMPPRSLGRQFMRAVVNPGVALILRSPAHRLLSGSLLLLTVRGRKTGLEHHLPVQFARGNGLLYVMPGSPRGKQWWRNLTGGAPVALRLAGRQLAGHAEALAGTKHAAEIRNALELYFSRFPASARLHHVRRHPDGTFDPADLQHAAIDAVVVRIRPSGAA